MLRTYKDFKGYFLIHFGLLDNIVGPKKINILSNAVGNEKLNSLMVFYEKNSLLESRNMIKAYSKSNQIKKNQIKELILILNKIILTKGTIRKCEKYMISTIPRIYLEAKAEEF